MPSLLVSSGSNNANHHINIMTKKTTMMTCHNDVEKASKGEDDTSSSSVLPPRSSTAATTCWTFGNTSSVRVGRKPSTKTQSSLEGDDDTELIANELNKLSVQERERLYDEIHGVACLQNETPEFIEDIMKKFDIALANQIPRPKRLALERAIFLKPHLLKDTKFKLMFLRADYYDPRKAALRLAEFFDNKRQLFGDHRLVKPIRLEDLTEEEIRLFRTGFYMMLPHPDNSGRPIWISDYLKTDFRRPLALKRISWYMVMKTLEENEDAQLKGVSNIYWGSEDCPYNVQGLSLGQITEGLKDWGSVIPRLPCRVTSDHFCFSSCERKNFLSLIRAALGKHLRLRVRTHFGSGVEIQYSLLTYGISCPFHCEQEKYNYHQTFLQRRLAEERIEKQQKGLVLEKQRATTNTNRLVDGDEDDEIIYIESPNPNDVLVGRGLPYQTHIGNLRLGDLVETKYLSHFMSTDSKVEKTLINLSVVNDIRQQKLGRFIERTSQGWVLSSDEQARKKVNSCFRSKVAAAAIHNSSNDSRKLDRRKHKYDTVMSSGGDNAPVTAPDETPSMRWSIVSTSTTTTTTGPMQANSSIGGFHNDGDDDFNIFMNGCGEDHPETTNDNKRMRI